MADDPQTIPDLAQAIASLSTEMQAGFAGVNRRLDGVERRLDRMEVTMREGFRNVNEVLADHTERLKNVEKDQHPVAGD